MEHAPLRPVPGRPSGQVSDADAVRHVGPSLPTIGAREARALALVAFVGRERAEVAQRVGLDPEALAEALAFARKELRRGA